jgi:hypothetical protein
MRTCEDSHPTKTTKKTLQINQQISQKSPMAANAQGDQYEFKIIAERIINALFQIIIIS